jgi:hypothetical protein
MYASWKGRRRQNLEFKLNDFSNTDTYDLMINYFKRRYKDKWIEICCVLLNKSNEEFEKIYRDRIKFYNK